MEKTPILKLLLKMSLPVMCALLIQSAYNIIDSYFVSQYSSEGFAALAIIFPIQLLMTALSTGTGTGLNILISRMDGNKDLEHQKDVIKSGLFLGLLNYIIFVVIALSMLNYYFKISTTNTLVRTQGILYARIIFIGSLGLFIEANCTKLLQAKGNMVMPMIAAIIGAIVNVILDPLLIFSFKLGIQGAAIASIIGQIIAMLITLAETFKIYKHNGHIVLNHCIKIYKSGLPSIIMQSLYTLYIVGLNLILKQFTEDAVTVLGIYYKLQTFFFIPLMGLQQAIVPIISYNYGSKNKERIKKVFQYSLMMALSVMFVATLIFILFNHELVSIFSTSTSILNISRIALPVISLSFIPAGFSMIFTVYFQGVDQGKNSLMITLLRQIFLLVPLAYLFHYLGLNYVWLTFPVTEIISVVACFILFHRNKKMVQ